MDWQGVVRLGEVPVATARIVYSRYQDTLSVRPVSRIVSKVSYEAAYALSYGISWSLSSIPVPGPIAAKLIGSFLLGWAVDRVGLTPSMANALVDTMNAEPGDVHVTVGPVDFNSQCGLGGQYGVER